METGGVETDDVESKQTVTNNNDGVNSVMDDADEGTGGRDGIATGSGAGSESGDNNAEENVQLVEVDNADGGTGTGGKQPRGRKETGVGNTKEQKKQVEGGGQNKKLKPARNSLVSNLVVHVPSIVTDEAKVSPYAISQITHGACGEYRVIQKEYFITF